MKVRIKFAKSGALVYIGHLDVMRYFQKLFRRANIPICYSEGFSPHQILSFSHPLPLGMESIGEYADIEIHSKISSAQALRRLREKSVPEIEILSFNEIPEKAENAMASVKAAKYQITIQNDDLCDIKQLIDTLLAKDVILVTKTTKKATKEVDIRPLIYELYATEDNAIEMLISSGSSDNLKPELVMKALYETNGLELDENDLHIKRIDQYTTINNRLISLDEIGCAIL